MDVATIYVAQCQQPFLQLDPDRFPSDTFEIHGETIVTKTCFQFSGASFEPEDVEVIGNCFPGLQVQVSPTLDELLDIFQGGSCPNPLPTVTWFAVVNNGGQLDTVSTLTYKIAERAPALSFLPAFENLLGVDTILSDSLYKICEDMLLDSMELIDLVGGVHCNSNVSVSTGKKKPQFSGGVISSEKSLVSPCDTLPLFWVPVDTTFSPPVVCLYTDTLFLTLLLDTEPPVFTFFPIDTILASGSLPVFGIPIIEDNCVLPDFTYTDDLLIVGADSVFTRTWTANDGCRTTTATQTITIQALHLDCPADLTVTAPPGASGVPVSWLPPQASTPCDSASTDCQPESIPGFNLLGELNGTAYYISTTEKNWTDAQADCVANGGQLAIADSPEKNSFLASGIGFFNAAYIGLSDKDIEGDFKWLNGAPLTYQNWEAGQPDVGGKHDYVAMNGWNQGRWAVYHFWTAKKYILEKSCTGGSGLTIVQTQGLPSGSFFPVGETAIAFEATDACGNSATCSFTVWVEPGNGGGCDENLSLNKPALQSSTRDGGVASRAVDGNTSGNFWLDFSVSQTEWEDFPWWEVDIQKKKFIRQINLWNRTDCCAEHLSGLYVLVSDVPFVSYNLSEVLAQAGVSAYFIENQVGLPGSVSVNRTGRYVRLQMNKQSFLALAEVEVLGCDANPNIGAPPPGDLKPEFASRSGAEDDFMIFPNPAKNQAHIHLQNFVGKDVAVLISSSLGQPVFRQVFNDLPEEVLEVDLRQHDIGSGVYVVSVICRGRAMAKRMVVSSHD